MKQLLLLALSCLPAFAQVTTGSISGFVLDPANRPMPQITVVIRDEAHSFERSVLSDNSGYYRFAGLPPSTYELTSAARGFTRASIPNIILAVNGDLRADLHPALAGKRESIAVTDRISPLETESSDLGAVLERQAIAGLPLNERDFLQLALLTPGVLPPVQDSQLSTRGNFAMHANGGREEFNNFLLDGVDNNDPDVNGYVLQPSVDAIQEFKIATNSYGAEYGRNAGGQVNVITRSGTNEFHGFAYEYLRNKVLDARNFFDASNKPQLIRNQFGGGLDGPAIRRRTFFFADYDALRGVQGYSRLATVPTAAQKNGDLSGLPPAVNPFTSQPFTGNQIPASAISPISRKILDLYPSAAVGGAGNYLAQPLGNTSLDQYNIRIDHRLSDSQELTMRYSYGHKDILEPYTENSPTNVPGFGDYVNDRGHNALLNYARILGSRVVNSLLLGFNRSGREILQQNHNTDVNRLWGVNYLPSDELSLGYPSISVSGFSGVGDIASLPIDRHTNTYQLGDTLSLIRGNHAYKLGAEFRRIQLNGTVSELPRGAISFLGAITGSGIGDLLLGFPTFAIDAQLAAPQTLRTLQSNFFAQDDWQVRPGFTLNFGARYEYNTPPTDPTNRMSALNLATRQLSRVGTNGLSRSALQSDYNNIAPRLGFAWSAGQNLVIRGGYGLFYDASMFEVSSALYFNPPWFTISAFFPSATSLLTMQNPFPLQGGFTPPASLSTLAPDLRTPYLQDWNLNVQQEIAKVGTFSVAYAGSKGTKLIRSLDLNQPSPAPGDVDSRRPYQGFSNIFYTESGGNSTFNSLQASLNRRTAAGLTVMASYMYSKSLDDTSAFLGTGADKNFPQDSSNYHAEHAASSFDIRQYATVAAVYRLPLRNAWLRHTELRNIVSMRSGQPFTPILSLDTSNTGNTGGSFGSDRPDLLASAAVNNPNAHAWFNTSAFALPRPYTFGSAGRNILRAPGVFTWDASVARRFELREKWSLTMEAQAFNLLNRTNFDLPQAFADQPSFGEIFSAKASRQIQFALRLMF